mmetsp:Transcript_26067/g.49229  ORF Transcript_26067/g.49229 Transcript_26067/m.49229 type:complete len:156 (-) Transcript_26067:156-623(-)
MVQKMKKQESFGIVAGGFNEASQFARNQERVYLRKRKGFIKYALQYGYKVCPAYTFGESNTYWNLGWMPHAVKETLNRLGIPTVAPFGQWWFPLLPHADQGIHTIVGAGRQFPNIPNPTLVQIDEYHQWYVEALKTLFDNHKWRFGMSGVELQIR